MNRAAPLSLVTFVALVASCVCACNSAADNTGPSASSSSGGSGDEDERGSVGPAHPSYAYCTKRGGKIDSTMERCVFPDGTSCLVYEFWNGVCGQAHTYCEEHGGKIERKERDMGGWKAIVAVCTLDGKECDEQEFLRTGKCP